jgi:hypothetical protein
MAKRTSKLRAQAEQVYTLTDQLQVQLKVLEEARASLNVRVRFSRSTLPGENVDIETLAFIVLMQASKSAQDDLKAIMAQVKAINRAKEKQRELLNKLKAAESSPRTALDFESVVQLMLTIYAKQLEAEFEAIQEDIDSLSELGEMESLRLQLAMDRLSKMMSTLSNLMKKISDTTNQIVQNLK